MATATKKENKVEKKQSKSAQIREYVKAHRAATAKEVAEKFQCSIALVHNIRGSMKRGKKKVKKSSAAVTMPTPAAIEPSPTDLCVAFVRAVGGFAEARKMLMTAEAFSGLKIR